MKRFILSIACAFAALISAAQANDIDFLHSLNKPDYHLVNSETIERPFHIYVRLPHGYEESEENYPTIYLLDGGTTFPLLGSYYNLISIDYQMPEAIIVGISYGGRTFSEGNYRSTDFTAPTTEVEYWGGASNYQTFLETELIPMIENNYRSNPEKRIIYGQSLGGQFVLYTAQTKPELFWGHIASNPALHRNLSLFTEEFIPEEKTSSKVFVSSGTNDAERFRTPALSWIDVWTNRKETPWELNVTFLDGEPHASAAPRAFRAGMLWLFEDETADTE